MRSIPTLPSPKLEVRDLRLVLALVEGGTTKGAAGLLHLSQPSVSRALLSLEEWISQRLFERTPDGLLPTAACRAFAERAVDLLDDLGALDRSLREPYIEPSRLNLVCECHTAYHWLPSTLRALRNKLPEVQLALRIEHTDDPTAALREGHVDAALLTSRLQPSRDLQVRPLFRDEILFVLAASHPLARRRTLSPSDLREHPLFSSPTAAHERRWFMKQVFGRARPKLQLSTFPLTEAVVDFARAGMGIALLTEWIVRPYLARGDLVAKRMTAGPLERSWSLAWRRELGDTGPALLSALKSSNPKAKP